MINMKRFFDSEFFGVFVVVASLVAAIMATVLTNWLMH
jgi:hypothetical protein